MKETHVERVPSDAPNRFEAQPVAPPTHRCIQEPDTLDIQHSICRALPLPIAGLMSEEAPGVVARRYMRLSNYVQEELGSPMDAPFMTLSFMALLVLPRLKLSDQGLFDGEAFAFVDPFVGAPPQG